MQTTGFNFIEAYRTVDPTATREIVTAREQAFKVIRLTVGTIDRIHDLCRLAFHLPFDAAQYAGWFDKPIRDADPHFVILHDAADAGRMASMVLRDLMLAGSEPAAMSILATSFAGKRAAFDRGNLVSEARDLISKGAKLQKMEAPSGDLSFTENENLKTNLETMDAGFAAPPVKSAIEGVNTAAADAVAGINRAYQALRKDSIRLADEIDMLWFHIGDWSNILEVQRTTLSPKILPLVSGIDLGAMVRDLPGPYGVYGIIRRTIGKAADKPVIIEDSINDLDAPQLAKLACDKTPDIFPLHTALMLAARGGDWVKALHAACPDLINVTLSQAEVADQAYRERLSLVYAGLNK